MHSGYDYLLLMDQDSVATPGMVDTLLSYVHDAPEERIGILYALHQYKNYHLENLGTEVLEMLWVDTAGSLLNLAAFRACGPFLDELFIDHVDAEYCLRLKVKGFRIRQVNRAVMQQALGNMISKRFLFWTVTTTNYEPVRVYYQIRNRLFVSRKFRREFPWWSCKEALAVVYIIMKFLLFESQSLEKLAMAMRGILHYFTGTMGKYERR
jgi:rhamnosyltransferase